MKRRRTRWIFAFLLLGLLTWSLVACGGSEESAPPPAAATDAPTEAAQPPTEAPTEVAVSTLPVPPTTAAEPTMAVAPTEAATPAGTPIQLPHGEGVAFDEDGLRLGQGSEFVVLDEPRFVPAAEAVWLRPEEVIIGVSYKGENRAYPIRQMAYHHIANDTIAGDPYLVTY